MPQGPSQNLPLVFVKLTAYSRTQTINPRPVLQFYTGINAIKKVNWVSGRSVDRNILAGLPSLF